MTHLIARSRAPLRLGLAGGGTDVSPYSDKYGGLALNVTIGKFANASIVSRDDTKVEFVASDTNARWIGELEDQTAVPRDLSLHVAVYNRIVRDFNSGRPLAVSVTTHSEAPLGSGLGSSSTMVVALVRAFGELLSLPFGEYDVAQLAYQIERSDLALACGKQDQYAATFGGLNFMEFNGDNVIVNPLRIKQQTKAELEASLVLFYTGMSRDSTNIIGEQTNNVSNGASESTSALHQVKDEAIRMKEAVLKNDFEDLASTMREAWDATKRIAKNISNPKIDELYTLARTAGAKAGNVSGAGEGGFLLFFVDPIERSSVMRALGARDGQVLSCTFTDIGAHSWRVS